MTEQRLMLITGDRKGIGRYLVEYYANKIGRIIEHEGYSICSTNIYSELEKTCFVDQN